MQPFNPADVMGLGGPGAHPFGMPQGPQLQGMPQAQPPQPPQMMQPPMPQGPQAPQQGPQPGMMPPQGPQGMQQPQQGMMQQPQPQGQMGMMGGMGMSVPSPNEDVGFWERIRLAAQRDPGFFYTVLGQLAANDRQGMVGTIENQRQLMAQTGLAQQRMASEERTNQESKRLRVSLHEDSQREGRDRADQVYVDRVRARAEKAGVLERFEGEAGTVQDRDTANELERFMSREARQKTTSDEKLKVAKAIARNPDFKESGFIKKYTDSTSPDYDPDFKESIDNIRKESKRLKQQLDDERKSRQEARTLRNEALRKATTDKVNAADKLQLSKMQRDETQVLSEIDNLNREYMLLLSIKASGFPLGDEQEASLKEYEGRLKDLETQREELDQGLEDMLFFMGAAKHIPASRNAASDITPPTNADYSDIEGLLGQSPE